MCPATPAPAALPMFIPRLIPSGLVELAQNPLHALGQVHHFVGGLHRQLLQLVQMGKRDDHYVPGGVGIGVEHHVAVLAAMDNAGFGIISGLGQIAKNAAGSFIDAGDVSVAPGRPEVVHGWAE